VGSFYVNLTVRSDDQSAVAAALKGRSALVTPAQHGCVVVADAECDKQDQDAARSLARMLSRQLSCIVLVVLNHDDDILWYFLTLEGEISDEYDSSPGYFDPNSEPSAPVGGDAKVLCKAFDSSAALRVEAVLRKSSFDDDGYVFASDRHRDLVAALEIPNFAVGLGFESISAGYFPDGISKEQLLRVS